MLTIFSTPKPFRNHIGVIQSNAIQSWVLLRPQCEVILLGNEEGTDKIVAQFGIRHIPEVECNEYGTPLVSDMFKIAQDIASYPLMCYINADIILPSDFIQAIRQINNQSFLCVGQRWDVDIRAPIDFSDPDWETRLRAHVAKVGKLHTCWAIDYFVFPRGLHLDIPAFAIGRRGWDNWMIYQARCLNIPVIDATDAVTVIHQNHNYSHLPGEEIDFRTGPEARRNLELSGGHRRVFDIRDATWVLSTSGLKPVSRIEAFYRHVKMSPTLHSLLLLLSGMPKKALSGLVRIVGQRGN